MVSPQARSDIDEFWEDAERRWGTAEAEASIRLIWHVIEAVAAQPEMGQACRLARADYHAFASGAHCLFYRLTPDGIIVLRGMAAGKDLARRIWGREQSD